MQAYHLRGNSNNTFRIELTTFFCPFPALTGKLFLQLIKIKNMATYLIKREITITRQEGDTADVVIVVPEVINMENYNARFAVKDNIGKTVFEKKSENSEMTITGQTITIPLLVADTKKKAGKHRWELQITNENEVITIGRGFFVIVNEIIK